MRPPHGPPSRLALAALLLMQATGGALAAPGWPRPAVAGQRLGDTLAAWLNDLQAPAAGPPTGAPATEPPPYPLGLMWLSASERSAQLHLAEQVQAGVRGLARDAALPATAAQHLGERLARLPVTGRILLPQADARLMQTTPALDPVLGAGDLLYLPPRPATVTVLRDNGRRCDIPFEPERDAAAYLRRCALTDDGAAGDEPAVDELTLVQPDGRTRRVGVAGWNAAGRAIPAPGAWIWAPRRAAAWPAALNEQIARLLATQGPALAPEHAVAAPGAATLGSAASAPAHGDPAPQPPAITASPAASVAGAPPSAAATPAGDERPARDLPLSAGDWGLTGLLQTPTARTRPGGDIGLTVSRTWPYTQTTVTLSPFDRLEIGVRYTNISNRLYGPTIAGDQSYKDKSAEIKLRLLDEDALWPALAVGLRDPGGTGLFAGEYLVASKRWGDLDLSLGLGWGYLGARGKLPNPLAPLGERFRQREAPDVGRGGTAHLGALFTGRTALFGGVQWHTPWEPLLLKLELDGNDYRHEPLGNRPPASSPFNLGAVWRWGALGLSLGLERGQQWTLGLQLQGSLPAMSTPKIGLARAVAVDDEILLRPPGAAQPQQPPATPPTDSAAPPQAAPPASPRQPTSAPASRDALTLRDLSEQTGWRAIRLLAHGDTWRVTLDDTQGLTTRERLDRGLAVLHRDAPASVRAFHLTLAQHGVPTVTHQINRVDWVREQARWLPPAQRTAWVAAQQPADSPPRRATPTITRVEDKPAGPTPGAAPGDTLLADAPAPRAQGHLNLGYQQNIGGPDGYLAALSAHAHGQWRLWPGAWLQGTASLRLIDNYDQFSYTAPSALPRVRTRLREYLTSRRVTVPNLQLTQFSRLDDSLYGLAYGGLLEPMFAGVGGELLWRPRASAWGLGLDVNRVRQRGFEQGLALRDYEVTTGHLSLHWDTGWNDVLAEVSAGQYLAGDRGATLDVSRVFGNGTRIGAWATKTNVSAAQFGEGSFDKGLYISIPFDAFFTTWSGPSVSLAWQPLIRDGGARLQRYQTLWGLTQQRDGRALLYESEATRP